MLVAALSCMALRWRKGVAAMALAMSLVHLNFPIILLGRADEVIE
jgi:hypothetical protein